MNLSKLLVPTVLVGFLIVNLGGPSKILDNIDNSLFGITSDDTVYAYLNAPRNRRIKFDVDLCKGGKCLPAQARNCGFDLNEFYAVEQCFDFNVTKVNPMTRVGDVRMACGLKFAEPDRGTYSRKTPEDCRWFGGTWGVKPQIPLSFTR